VEVVQDSLAQPAIGVHPHVRSAVALHAAVSIDPAGQASVEHGRQAFPTRYVPALHARQVSSVEVVQDSLKQSAIGVQPHVRSAVALHAAVSIDPVGHASVEHGRQALPLK
jgi:hypothetical protein